MRLAPTLAALATWLVFMCNYSRKGIAQVRAVFPLQVGHIVSYESISTIWGIQLPLLISSSVNEKHQKTYEDHRFDPLLLFIRTYHTFIPFLSCSIQLQWRSGLRSRWRILPVRRWSLCSWSPGAPSPCWVRRTLRPCETMNALRQRQGKCLGNVVVQYVQCWCGDRFGWVAWFQHGSKVDQIWSSRIHVKFVKWGVSQLLSWWNMEEPHILCCWRLNPLV
jgi:hypothetical protein